MRMESGENLPKPWSVWIDKNKKVISIKENPKGKELFFENKEAGVKAVTELISKGYQIG